jgi:hypothetical protein
MATFTRLSRGFKQGKRREPNLVAGYGVEMWYVSGLTVAPGGITTVAHNDLFNDPAFPRRLGDPHPDGDMPPQTVVVDIGVYRAPANGRCILYVVFGLDPNYRWGAAPRLFGAPSAEIVSEDQPRVQTYSTGGESFARIVYHQVPRVQAIRRRPKYIIGNVENIADQIEANLGRRYWLEGIPYVLGAYNIAATQTIGLHILTYTFWTMAPLQGIPALSQPGVEVNIPALGYLERWAVTDGGMLPQVHAVPMGPYELGGPLP